MDNKKNNTNTLAIVGFVLSFFIEIAGLICSIIGLKKSKELNGDGRGFSIAGIIISSIKLFLDLIVIAIMLLSFFYISVKSSDPIKNNIINTIEDIEESIDEIDEYESNTVSVYANNKTNNIEFIYNEEPYNGEDLETKSITKVQVKINGNFVEDFNIIYSYNTKDTKVKKGLDNSNVEVLKGKDKDYFVLLIPEEDLYVDGSTSPVIVNEDGKNIYKLEYPHGGGVIVTDKNSNLFGKNGKYYIDNDKMYFIKQDCTIKENEVFKENVLTVENDEVIINEIGTVEAIGVGGTLCLEN